MLVVTKKDKKKSELQKIIDMSLRRYDTIPKNCFSTHRIAPFVRVISACTHGTACAGAVQVVFKLPHANRSGSFNLPLLCIVPTAWVEA